MYLSFAEERKLWLKTQHSKMNIMTTDPITSWQIDREKMEIVADFIFLGSKITVDGDYSSVQLLSPFLLFATPWTAACQAFLSITNSRSLLKLMSIGSVMPSNHVILCCPLLLPPSIIPSIRVFSNESVICTRWSKYWSFSFSISPSDEYSGRISLQSKGLSRVFNTTVQKHQFFSTQLSL